MLKFEVCGVKTRKYRGKRACTALDTHNLLKRRRLRESSSVFARSKGQWPAKFCKDPTGVHKPCTVYIDYIIKDNKR